MKRYAQAVIGVICLAFSLGMASIPTDSIGEGSILGLEPVATDTVRDTTFHVGDTLWLGDGKYCVKPDPLTREDVAFPSVRTDLKIIAGDGFAHGWITQTFYNPYDLPFNATYVFPMPYNGAVHGMSFTSRLGSFKAIIKEKAVAESLFTAAQQAGQQAALLTQTQRSIFTQKLANILPHDSIKVIITFSMALSYDLGTLELAFPTTIGHRYGAAPLAKRSDVVSPVYIRPGTRPVNSLDFSILICTPFDISDVASPNFPVSIVSGGVEAAARQAGLLTPGEAIPEGVKAQFVKLSASGEIPNRDIVVRFTRASSARDLSLLSWRNGTSGYFAMQLYPDIADTNGKPQSIDMVFVIDRSGSMMGQPMELSKKIVNSMLSKATPNDRIFLIAFDNTTMTLFPAPVTATPDNIQKAKDWVNTLAGGGGTEMLSAVRQALAIPLLPGATRIMSLITDGGVWAVDSIYTAIKNDGNTIAFAFGVGASPNRDLIDGAAMAGRGMGQNIGYNDNIDLVVNNFWTRIRAPQLENVTIDWGANPPTGCTRDTLGSLWVGQPLVLFGQYGVPGARMVTLSGTKAGVPFSQSFPVTFCANNTVMEFVPAMWARQTMENLLYAQTLAGNEGNKSKILSLSLEYDVLCKYTAFIAIADTTVANNPALSGNVPLVIPQGTDPNLYQYDATKSVSYGILMDVQDKPKPAQRLLEQIGSRTSFAAVRGAGHVVFHLSGLAAYDPTAVVRIFDVRGRLVRFFRIAELAAAGFVWDCTASNGRRIFHGQYIATLVSTFGRSAVAFVVK
jgi:Ca-activated chloride channel family protein